MEQNTIMNRIILAYAPENAALADSVDHPLSRIGIPFEHASGNIAAQIGASEEPVLLLVTDNLLTNRSSMEGLMEAIRLAALQKRLVAVVADGIDAQGNPIPTHIDRMANALHYMKHWQDVWLALSDAHQHAAKEAKTGLSAELDINRGIANEVGDLISHLRDAGWISWEQFVANDFEAFFKKFNLNDWHGQYKRLVAQLAENQLIDEQDHLPELSIAGGFLSPAPVEDAEFQHLGPAAKASEPAITPVAEQIAEALEPAPQRPEPTPSSPPQPDMEAQAAKDAWFWIEKGHLDRGLELFQNALEHFPESAWLKTEYERAVQQAAPQSTPAQEPLPEVAPTQAPANTTDESKSYDLMGDMAAERGDYLFAKYCWDRVAEIDPLYADIYRKLGLMTSEHLHEYRETAAIYLQKALEINPQDVAVRAALQGYSAEAKANLAPSPIEKQEILAEEAHASQAPSELPGASKLVLITGATSGIGQATAEIFAKNGYRLILTGRRVERLVALKNRFEIAYGTEVLLLPFDVRDPGATEAALTNLPESFQEIDILVNNAGLAKGLAPIHEGQLEHWETMIDTNIKGLLYVTRLVSSGMVQRRRGHIINVGSSASKEAYPNGNVYCATKFGVEALTRSMRFDLHAYNIRVSQVSPGHVEETEFALTRFDGDAERAKIYNDFQPLRSSDVADAIYYMATRPPHVNVQDIQLFATQQASSMVINRSGR